MGPGVRPRTRLAAHVPSVHPAAGIRDSPHRQPQRSRTSAFSPWIGVHRRGVVPSQNKDLRFPPDPRPGADRRGGRRGGDRCTCTRRASRSSRAAVAARPRRAVAARRFPAPRHNSCFPARRLRSGNEAWVSLQAWLCLLPPSRLTLPDSAVLRQILGVACPPNVSFSDTPARLTLPPCHRNAGWSPVNARVSSGTRLSAP